jgi:hypothetical protein
MSVKAGFPEIMLQILKCGNRQVVAGGAQLRDGRRRRFWANLSQDCRLLGKSDAASHGGLGHAIFLLAAAMGVI